MVAFEEDCSFASSQAIEPARYTNAEALHTASKLRVAVGLNNQMQMCPLNAPVNDTQAVASAQGNKRTANDLHALFGAQTMDLRAELEGDVRRRVRRYSRSLAVEDTLAAAFGARPAGTRPPAPSPEAHDPLTHCLFLFGRHACSWFDSGQILLLRSDNLEQRKEFTRGPWLYRTLKARGSHSRDVILAAGLASRSQQLGRAGEAQRHLGARPKLAIETPLDRPRTELFWVTPSRARAIAKF